MIDKTVLQLIILAIIVAFSFGEMVENDMRLVGESIGHIPIFNKLVPEFFDEKERIKKS